MTVEKLSPELISAQWKKDNIAGLSHETIYKFIWQSKLSNKKCERDYRKIYQLLRWVNMQEWWVNIAGIYTK